MKKNKRGAARKKKKRAVAKGAGHSEEPVVVLSRKNSKKPVEVPLKNQLTKAEARKLKALNRRFEGITPQGREITRKITIQARRKLYESPPACRAAPHAATPQPLKSDASRSAQVTAAKVNASPPPAPAAAVPSQPPR